MATPRRISLTQDELSRNLIDRFVLGTEAKEGLMPSARILAEEFGVSRLFLREVLAGLQRQGLIESVPGKGVYVKKPDMLNAARNVHLAVLQSSATARNLIEARTNLEEQCASLAAARATKEDIAEMEYALEVFDNASSLIQKAQADIAFHSLIARSTHNPVLQIMFGSITSLAFETMLRSLSDPEIFNLGAPLHHAMLKAIKKQDPQAALKAMSKHLHIAEDSYQADLDNKLSDVANRIVKEVLHSTMSIEQVLDSALRDFKIEIVTPG